MRIECILKRVGGTQVTIQDRSYHFEQQADEAHVATVEHEGDQALLLSIHEGYRPYKHAAPAAAAPVAPVVPEDFSIAPPAGASIAPLTQEEPKQEEQPAAPVVKDRAALAAEYKALTKKGAHHTWDADEIAAKIAALKA